MTSDPLRFENPEAEQSIPQRFCQQVAKYAGRIAIKSTHYEWRYEELNEAAQRIAGAILARCILGKVPVALLLENDAPMIVAILGVLMAGKICVPLDPSYHQARMASVLNDSQAGERGPRFTSPPCAGST